MAETIPVSLKKGYTWRFDKSLGILIEMVYGISKSGWRIVHHAVSRRLRLDSRSRAEDDNPWIQKEQEKQRVQEKEVKICSLRRGNKGLAMELTISSMLTYLDHPEAVQCNCSTSASGLPNKAAGGGEPDIVYRPPGSSGYQVVCEVSANKSMSDPDYRQQLDSALLHAEDEHTFAKVKVTYALMINLREAGSDEKVHEVYRTFLKENENKLRLWGPIRFVLMEAAEFAKAVNLLRYEEVLSFRTELFAAALDDLHEAIWDKDLPQDFDWMADRVYGVIHKGQQMDASVFPGPRKVEEPDA